MFFLYMGAFPPYQEIVPQTLVDCLSAEGFLEPTGEQTFEDFFEACLANLSVCYHLVLYASKNKYWFLGRKCRVHSCWQYLCKEEASKIKFLHVIQSFDDNVKDQRRLCVHCNTLLGFKQVYDSIKSECGSTARSLLCFGPYQQYPVPIHAMGFKLLRVLNALRVRFYSFPFEILKLVYLHYLALTCNGDLPTSISKLFLLQYLIVHRHIKTKRRGTQTYMPAQIWDMKEVKHIEISGSDLPTPASEATLSKLTTLGGVSANSCTREVLRRIPNIKTLGIEVELKPYDDDSGGDSNPLSYLGYISKLKNLEELTYCVANPEVKHESVTTTSLPLSMFPSSLKRLHLSGLGYPWEYMNDIGWLLPNLEMLKLQCYAFRGPEWVIKPGCFPELYSLVIEDADLVQWRPRCGSFPKLQHLSMKHCYKLRQLHWRYNYSTIREIELVECNPLAVAWANKLRRKVGFKFSCRSSF